MKNKPWDKRPDESVKAYAAFRKYLEMGHNRSLNKAADNVPWRYRWFGRWSSKYQWVSRTQAWDVAELERMGQLGQATIARAKTRLADAAEVLIGMLIRMGVGQVEGVTGMAQVKACIEGLGMLGIVSAQRLELTGAEGQPVQLEQRTTVTMDRLRTFADDADAMAAIKLLAIKEADSRKEAN